MKAQRPNPLTESGNFDPVLIEVASSSGYERELVNDDYWLIRGLYGIARELAGDDQIRLGPSPADVRRAERQGTTPLGAVVGHWGFAGGTSLTAAWQLAERFSSDVDYFLYAASEQVSRKALKKARQRVATWVTEEVGGTRSSAGSGDIRISQIVTPDGRRFKLDGVNQPPDLSGSMTEWRPVQSIIARCLPELQSEHPELGGFSLPVVVVPITAVNKLDALHRRAVVEGSRGRRLAFRVRDVFDLAAIARSKYADETRNRIPELAVQMMVPSGRHHEPRPASGYGSTDLFRPGSLAYEALRVAYETEMPDYLPSGAPLPDFADSMKAIRDLDAA